MTRHQAYGLTLESEVELWPNASPPIGDVDVRVTVARERAPGATKFSFTRDTSTSIAGAGEIRVVGGERIDMIPEASVDDATLAQCAAGAGLAMILHQRGHFVIHGSTVALEGNGVCFAGPSGSGKSTLALSLAARGHDVISDGMTVVASDGNALTGPRATKLWPDTARHMGVDPERLEKVTPRHEKRFWALPALSYPSVPLCRVFVVNVGSDLAIEPLSPSDGLFAVLKNAFLTEYIAADAAAGLLERCGKLMADIDVVSLTLPDDFDELPSVLAQLEGSVRLPETRLRRAEHITRE